MKKIALIGSTGSIGKQVISVSNRYPDEFKIVSLSAHSNRIEFEQQVNKLNPKVACLDICNGDITVPKGVDFYSGENSYLNAVITEADIVVVSVVGFAGLKAVLKAIDLKKDIALANKESLVVGGEIVMQKAKENGVKITPIDSEHSAIWQALGFDLNKEFKRIILTASGGAFRDLSKDELFFATAKDALKHPNWNMGSKITIDCATLVNKAFEVIEAKWLYNTTFDKIDAIIHRESIIHSMVEFNDNSVMAQLSYPTMEIPIALALNHDKRLCQNVPQLDFKALKSLTFSEIDNDKFPCFKLVVNAGKKGDAYPAVANGANEIAVQAFLDGKIKYCDIFSIIDGALNAYTNDAPYSLDKIFLADEYSRQYAMSKIK